MTTVGSSPCSPTSTADLRWNIRLARAPSAARSRPFSNNGNLHRVELLAIPVTLVVLVLAFGSLVAALVPLLLGVTAVVAGLGLLGPLSHQFPVQDSAKTVIMLIGLAVGGDYALFYVAPSRHAPPARPPPR